MKKTLLAISITSQLFIPATGTILHPNESYQQEVVFGGTIKIKPTAWEWTTPLNLITKFNLSEETNATVSGADTIWKDILGGGNIPILEGRLKTPAKNGATGILPTITIDGKTVENNFSTTIAATISTENGVTKPLGTLDVELTNHLAIAFHLQGNNGRHTIASTYDLTQAEADIATITTGQFGFNEKPLHLSGVVSFASLAGRLSNPLHYGIAGYDDLVLTNATLNALTKDLSDGTWSATLPITVRLQ